MKTKTSKKEFKALGASSMVRLSAALEAAKVDGYEPMGTPQRQIRLWQDNVYQMLFVQNVRLVEAP